ncbi:hypothetical protein BDN72DRAFT_836196 [Pluteus cervinus]|uniref:Uncharacterized protein n=1 Tax=Pluteus cervinus TaxID=181527 RepID=A0ACD3B326_9AGAR|nr:hypothetical protein BDN72DRAFT_836196 [Pluteus cervinus]
MRPDQIPGLGRSETKTPLLLPLFLKFLLPNGSNSSPTICVAMQNSGILPDALYHPIVEAISGEKMLHNLR